jgi:hypothetical protein
VSCLSAFKSSVIRHQKDLNRNISRLALSSRVLVHFQIAQSNLHNFALLKKNRERKKVDPKFDESFFFFFFFCSSGSAQPTQEGNADNLIKWMQVISLTVAVQMHQAFQVLGPQIMFLR